MNILVGDVVSVEIQSLHGETKVIGPVTAIGLHNSKEGVTWFQIAGMTTTFWSDEVDKVTKNG